MLEVETIYKYMYIHIIMMLCRAMYGLERFGDYLMKMSQSCHANKHVSICYAYLLHELCSFLALHDPEVYRASQEGFAQSHMFNISKVLHPSSWEVSGCKDRTGVYLNVQIISSITALYRKDAANLFPASFDVSRMNSGIFNEATQIVGNLWCGVRYFDMYYEGYHQHILGRGTCCIALPSIGHQYAYDGTIYCIIRNIIHHQAVIIVGCPHVYFFYVEILRVRPSTTDVPLLEADTTAEFMWVSQADVDYYHANQQFCFRDHDDQNVSQFYLILLN